MSMAATDSAAASSPLSPHSVCGTSRTALPWRPALLPRASPSTATSAAEAWAAVISSTPYLAEARFRDSSTVYLPPTVLQLSEATGCSVSELAGAYNDLPVIRLSKEIPNAAAASTAVPASQTFDTFDYLQLNPVDETLELATNAVRARRPVADAEEAFWEADYWEKLKRIKQEQQQRKEQRRQNKVAQEAKKAPHGTGGLHAPGFPPTYALGNTISSTNSPSFLTPHSRQGSLSGHAGDTDTSPTVANLQSVQRQKRIAKGLLRRARYNESHNPSHPHPHTQRSASLLSQNSAGTPQSVVGRRARPRSYSTNSQQTDVRGFQYSLSSVMSDGGHSALSDSLRTPPLLSINPTHPARDPLATSLDMDLSMSGGATKSGATTRSRNSAVAPDRGTTPKVSPPHHNSGSPQRSPCVQPLKDSDLHDSASLLSYDSEHSLTCGGEQEALDKASTGVYPSPTCIYRPPPKAITALRIPLVTIATTDTTSPMAQAGGRASGTPSKPTERVSPQLVPKVSSTASGDTGAGIADTKDVSNAAPPASAHGQPLVALHRKPSLQSGSGALRPVVKAEPGSRGAIACPTSSTRTGYTASTMATSRPQRGSPLVPAPTRRTSAIDGTASSPSPPPSEVQRTNPITSSSSPTPRRSARGGRVVTPNTNSTGLQVQVPDIVVDNTRGDNKGRPMMNVPPTATDTASSSDSAICEPSNPTSPVSTAPTYGHSTLVTAAPTPLSSPQGPPPPDSAASKFNPHNATTTPSGSATPRATAPTVPPSRTPTREASMSPRFERAIAVHGAAPTSSNPPAAAAAATTGASSFTADPSPAVSLSATLPHRGPTASPSREESGAVAPVDSTPPPGGSDTAEAGCGGTGGEVNRAAAKDGAPPTSAGEGDHSTSKRSARLHRAAAEAPKKKQEKKSGAACCTVM